MANSTSNLKLFSLQSSRSIRIAFLLEELGLQYDNQSYERQPNMTSPPEYKEESKSSFGKAPVLWDGDEVLIESGAITEYILEKYDTEHKLDGKKPGANRQKVLEFIHAAEATIMLHALAILYLRASAGACSSSSPAPSPSALDEMASALGTNVRRDLNWLELELQTTSREKESRVGKEEQEGGYLAGEFSAADSMMLFAVLFIFKRDLTAGKALKEWPGLEAWVGKCVARDGWKRAVEKTGFKL